MTTPQADSRQMPLFVAGSPTSEAAAEAFLRLMLQTFRESMESVQ